MNAENFAEWFHRQDYGVLRTQSSYWYEAGPRVYQAFPYHWVINPSEKEIKQVFEQSKAIALRYSAPFTAPSGCISYHVVLNNDKPYSISSLYKKARHDVSKGLEHACYEPITIQRLASDGWELRYETLVRQGRQHAEKREWWEKLCLSAEDLPGFESWGAIHDGELVAALLSYTLGNTTSILYQQSKTAYLRFRINNALTFAFSKSVLERTKSNCIFYGLHSLDAPSNVDKFKFRMGYQAKPIRQQIVFNPMISFLFNPLFHRFLRRIARRFPRNPALTKTEGMVRFYLEGKKQIEQQLWPEILMEQRENIISNLELEIN